ncbi:MAG: DUF4251 domain-containing protein [Prolixibacteraceae bacterium]
MKNIVFTLILLVSFFSVNAQDDSRKSRKERKAEKKAQKTEEIKSALNNKTFIFNATHALPMGGGSKYLNYDYDVVVKNDTVVSYLPFYGVAYHVEYGARNLGFDFSQPVEKYEMKKEDDGYMVDFEVDKGMDHLNYTFHISETGNATLHVSSTHRQSITYYGNIEKVEEKEE